MTRTTDLLKRIEEHEKRTSCMYVTGRNELKGRLDALKEEIKYLREFQKILNNNCIYQIGDRLASIKKEIKLIEEKI